jgi:DNA polymerase-3 subunit delta'
LSAAFPNVLGHAQAQEMLLRAIARGQLHHAIMLVGPRGIGKATLARALACALLCNVAPGLGCEGSSCGICSRVLAGNHPDVDWLLPEGAAGQIPIDAARACHLRQQNAPYEGRSYVIVIDPADALNEASGNALLKAIEEPRPGVHFVLLATNMQAVLPTILSRSLPIRLGRLSDEEVGAIVRAKAPELSEERRRMAVLLAEGSAGVALDLALDPALDRCLVVLREAIRAALAGPSAVFAGEQGPLWSAFSAAVQALAEAEAEAAAAAAEAAAQTTGKKRRQSAEKSKDEKSEKKPKEAPVHQRWVAGRLAELWTLHLRERTRGREGLPGMPRLDLSASAIVRQIGILQRFVGRVERNASVRLLLEQTLLELGEAA